MVHILPVIIIGGGIGLMLIFSGMREEPPKKKPVPRSKSAVSVVVEKEAIPADILAYGRMRSAQPVKLISEVSGPLQRGDVAFVPGTAFKKGDLLIKVDDRPISLEINSTKSDFLNALAAVLPEIKVDFPAEFPKWQDYFNAVSFDTELPDMPDAGNDRIKLFLSRYNVYKLYYTIRNLEIRKEKHFFRAPFSGTILSTDVRAGSSARVGSQLGEVLNLESLEVEVPVPATDVPWIDYGKTVQLTSNEISGLWTGRISRVGKSVDQQTQTLPIYIDVRSTPRDGLYDGIFLTASIPGEVVGDAFEVPLRAIYEQNYVYVIEGGVLDYRKVNIVRRQKNSVLVTDGLQTGDTLVTEILQGVAAGMPATAIINDGQEGNPGDE